MKGGVRPLTFLFYLLELYQAFTGNTGENSYVLLAREGEKKAFETYQNTLFFLTRLTLGRNYFIRA